MYNNHMKSSKIIKTRFSARKVDSILNYRLLNYAYVAADLIMRFFMGPPENPLPQGVFPGIVYGTTKSSVSKELTLIEKLRKDLLNKLFSYSIKFLQDKELNNKSTEEKKRVIIMRFGLSEFFKRFEEREALLKILLGDESLPPGWKIIRKFPPGKITLPERRGRPIDIKIAIASYWSVAMKESNKVSWINIVRLLKWFHSHIENTSYSEYLKLSERIRDKAGYLKKQCNQIIKKQPFFEDNVLYTYFYDSPPHPAPRFVEFKINSIKVGEIHSGNTLVVKELNFTNKRKPKYTEKIKDKMPSKPPYIAFPDGEIYNFSGPI